MLSSFPALVCSQRAWLSVELLLATCVAAMHAGATTVALTLEFCYSKMNFCREAVFLVPATMFYEEVPLCINASQVKLILKAQYCRIKKKVTGHSHYRVTGGNILEAK